VCGCRLNSPSGSANQEFDCTGSLLAESAAWALHEPGEPVGENKTGWMAGRTARGVTVLIGTLFPVTAALGQAPRGVARSWRWSACDRFADTESDTAAGTGNRTARAGAAGTTGPGAARRPAGAGRSGSDRGGVTVYDPATLQPLYADLVGTTVPRSSSGEVVEALQARYRSDGYILTAVSGQFETVNGRTVFVVRAVDGRSSPTASPICGR
jgi:hypothetical protein